MENSIHLKCFSLRLMVFLNLLLFSKYFKLVSVFLCGLINSFLGSLYCLLRGKVWFASILFLVFIGGLLVLFFYLVSIEANQLKVTLQLLVPLLSFRVLLLSESSTININNLLKFKEYLITKGKRRGPLFGLILVLFVMVFLNLLLRKSLFSFRRMF